MGRYFQWGRTKKQSISRALEEAAEDHYMDCPEAPLTTRTAAFIADVLLMVTLISTANRLLLTTMGFLGLLAPDTPLPPWLISLLVATDFTAAYFYSIWTPYEFGASPVKLLFNLRVIDHRSGAKLELTQLFLREWFAKPFGLFMGGIGFVVAFFRKDTRALHDLLSGSVVKKVDEASR